VTSWLARQVDDNGAVEKRPLVLVVFHRIIALCERPAEAASTIDHLGTPPTVHRRGARRRLLKSDEHPSRSLALAQKLKVAFNPIVRGVIK